MDDTTIHLASQVIGFLFEGALTCLMVIGWWLWRQTVATVVKVKEELADHKLYVANNYAKNDVISELRQTLATMANDIKELLKRRD